MPRGPFGGPRPFAKRDDVPGEIHSEPPSDYALREDDLIKAVEEYRDMWSGAKEGVYTPKHVILATYKLVKPVCLVEMPNGPSNKKRAMRFSKSMERFFFVHLDDDGYSMYLSRFKTLIDVVEAYGKDMQRYPDLEGILFGYSPSNVFGYIENSNAYNDIIK